MHVSVGICCYNEEKNVDMLLDNLLMSQSLPLNSEVIVVCSGCTDRTPEVVKKFSEKDERVRLIVEPTRNGKASALNKILSSFKGDIFVHLDADLIPSSQAIEAILKRLDDPTVGAVTGRQVPICNGELVGKLNAVVWGLHNETQKYCSDKGIAQHLSGLLFAIRRGLCQRVPGDIVNDDAFIGLECMRKGYKVFFEDQARTYFQCPDSLPEFINQRRRIIYGHLKIKKETGTAPMVLETSPLKCKLKILYKWAYKNRKLLPYFAITCLVELYVNILARYDLHKRDNRHKVWKIAKSTKKMPY